MLRYKILNKLFGWDYITISGWNSGFCRIYKSPDGVPYVTYPPYKAEKLLETDKIIFITCRKEKYFPNEKT